jgi:TnpA family transposase
MTSCALSEHDRACIDPYRTEANRLGVALQLCSLRSLGFCPVQLSATPHAVVASLATQLEGSPDASGAYGNRVKTRQDPVQDILSYLPFAQIWR